MSRRDQIVMSDAEAASFLEESRTVTCATIARDGRPHLMPLWYVVRNTQPASPAGTREQLWSWTYAKSQKAKNLERDSRATLGIEDGVGYEELRGVMFECDVRVERDPAAVEGFGLELFERYAADLTPEIREMVAAQAQKRVGLTFVPYREVTWDHRKLGGTY